MQMICGHRMEQFHPAALAPLAVLQVWDSIWDYLGSPRISTDEGDHA